MSVTTYSQLKDNLEYLKLNEMINHLDDTVNFINKNKLSFVDGLIRLTNYEIDHKEASMIKAMVKVGAFPHTKEIKILILAFKKALMKIR